MGRMSAVIVGILVLLGLGSCTQAGQSGNGSAEGEPAPAPLYVDDFEDGDRHNVIGTWMYTNLTTVNTFDAVSAPPGNGSYALELDAEMEATVPYQGGSIYWGASSVNTGSAMAATPVDVTDYGKICFGLSFLASGPGPELDVSLYGTNGTIKYELLSDFDSDFKEYSLQLSDFTVTSGSLSEIKASVEQIMFQVYVWGDNG
ncbi:MAG: hypothetical protein GVY29_09605, partial [Spirochaetes bacterium]|nr:hypothetical protein [Spirochaetota bacterium]